MPSPEALEAARAASGLAKLKGLPGQVNLQDGAWLEEGGFLKGHALDRMARRLRQGGARAGLIDFGGQLLVWGPARTVDLADPRERARPRLSLTLRDASLSSSVTSDRGRHILHPPTGRPFEP